MVKNDNFFQVSGWMLNDLKLSGNDLICFAIIYGFSQDGETSFSGSLKYLYAFMGASKSTAMRSLLRLEELCFIKKESLTINGITFNRYKANSEEIDRLRAMTPPVSECNRGGIKMTPGRYQNDTGGGIKMTPNNIVNNKEDNKEKKESSVIEIKRRSDSFENPPPVAPPPLQLDFRFTDADFSEHWAKWVEYKRIQFRDKYKSIKSEQAAVNRVYEMTNGSIQAAISAINYSMAMLYKGVYPNPNQRQNNGVPVGFQNSAQQITNFTDDQLKKTYDFNPVEYAKRNNQT